MNRLFKATSTLYFIAFALFTAMTQIKEPFWDMFSWIDEFLTYDRGQIGIWTYLWKAHNDHHMVLIRILTGVDVTLLGARGISFVAAALIAVIFAAAMIYNEVRQRPGSAMRIDRLGLICVMLLLTTSTGVDCSVPINSVYPITLVLMIASFVMFGGLDEPGGSTIKRIVAIGCALLASLANAVGLIALPILFWAAWRAGAGWRWLAALVLISAGYGIIYVQGLPPSSLSELHAGMSVEHAVKTFKYLLAYIGLPLSRAPGMALPSRGLGAVLLLAGIAAVIHGTFSRKRLDRLQRIGICLILVGLGSAVLAALGRVDLEVDVKVPVRYAVLVAPLHIGLLVVASELLRPWMLVPRLAVLQLPAAAAFALLLLLMQVVGGVSAASAASTIRTAVTRYGSGIRESGMERVVFPDLAEADRITAALRQHLGKQ